jgi:hypothetical protein
MGVGRQPVPAAAQGQQGLRIGVEQAAQALWAERRMAALAQRVGELRGIDEGGTQGRGHGAMMPAPRIGRMLAAPLEESTE